MKEALSSKMLIRSAARSVNKNATKLFINFFAILSRKIITYPLLTSIQYDKFYSPMWFGKSNAIS